MQHRHYPPAEYERTEGQPLSAWRLAQLWRGLPERERLGFLHSLIEPLADEVLVITAQPAQSTGGKEPD